MSDALSGLRLAGRRVVVVGGGRHALGAVTHLLRERAEVEVVAPAVEAAIEDLVRRRLLTWHARPYARGDLDGAWLVAARTGLPEVDEAVGADADAARVLLFGGPSAAGTARAPGGRGSAPGRVILVGGGPGDPGLLTIRGREAVLAADVVVVDRLAPLAVLDEVDADVEIVDVSKIPRGRHTNQEDINAVLVDRARAGRLVVRLKGGDPFVFGRGMEEAIACRDAGIDVEVVPGVTSSVAGPALAGVPVTHRGLVQGFAVVSGHVPPGHPASQTDWEALAGSGLTVVILMGVDTLPAIAAALLAGGRAAETPVACVMDAALPSQRTQTTTLEALAAGPPPGLIPPAVTVVGPVAGFADAGLISPAGGAAAAPPAPVS